MTAEVLGERVQLPLNTLIILHSWSFHHVSLHPSFPPSFLSSSCPFAPLLSRTNLNATYLFSFCSSQRVLHHSISFREKRGRVQSCHGNNKLAAGYLLPDFHWKRMMDIHFKPNFFYSQEKFFFFGWTKLLVNWSLHNQPESLFVCVGHQHFLVAVFRKNIMSFALIHSDNTDCSDCTRNKIVQETVVSP